jgi:hypothetical protein
MVGVPIDDRRAGCGEIDADDVGIGLGEHSHRGSTGDDCEVGGEARAARKAAEHRCVFFQDLDEDFGDHVVAINRREGQSPLAAGPVDHVVKESGEAVDEAIPSPRSPPEAVLHERGILRAPWPVGRSIGTRPAHGDASRQPASPGPPLTRSYDRGFRPPIAVREDSRNGPEKADSFR